MGYDLGQSVQSSWFESRWYWTQVSRFALSIGSGCIALVLGLDKILRR